MATSITNNIANATYSTSGNTLTVTASEGYRFDVAPTVSGYDEWDDPISPRSMTLSADGKTATENISDFTDGICNINGSVVPDVSPFTPPTIQNDISNTTYSLQDSVLTVTANSGWKFDIPPVIEGTDVWDDPIHARALTLSSDGKTATGDISDFEDGVCNITGSVNRNFIVNNQVLNTTYGYNNNGNSIFLYADSGWKFTSAPHIVIANEVDTDMTLDGTSTAYYVGLNNVTEGTTIILTGTTQSDVPEYTINVVTDLTLCTPSGIPSQTTNLATLDMTLTANQGCVFDTAPLMRYLDNEWEEYHTIPFILSSDNKTATLTVDLSILNVSNADNITIQGTANPESHYTDRYGMINVYNPTIEELEDFCAERFTYIDPVSGNTVQDLGEYVNSIRRVFCHVNDTTPSTIKCGNYDTSVHTRTPLVDVVILNFGEIEIPAHNGDNLDYDTEISLFLPFIGFVNISSAYVGQTVNLSYEINIVTGDGVAKLTYDETPFAVYHCIPSTEIMFKTNSMLTATAGGTNSTSLNLYGLKPYVLVKWNTSKNNNLINPDCVRMRIGDFTGFAKFIDVTDINNGQITADEKNLLVRLLSNGVNVEET